MAVLLSLSRSYMAQSNHNLLRAAVAGVEQQARNAATAAQAAATAAQALMQALEGQRECLVERNEPPIYFLVICAFVPITTWEASANKYETLFDRCAKFRSR